MTQYHPSSLSRQPSTFKMAIQKEDITAPDVIALLTEHVQDMRSSTPAAICRVLDLDALRKPSVTFYTARDTNGELQGCCAIVELSEYSFYLRYDKAHFEAPEHGEIKSMRTCSTHLRKGIARSMTQFLISEGRSRGMKKLSLETGAGEKWKAARKMYESCGFEVGEVYGNYWEDEQSVYMHLSL